MTKKKNKLGGVIAFKNTPKWRNTQLNQIMNCSDHGKFRAYQARIYGYHDCPECYRESENQYWEDSRRYSYWPG